MFQPKKIFLELIFSGILSVNTKAAPLVKASCINWQPCDLVPCIAKKTEFFLISFEEFEIWGTALDNGKSKPKQSFQISFEFINYKLTRSLNISLKTGAATSPPE